MAIRQQDQAANTLLQVRSKRPDLSPYVVAQVLEFVGRSFISFLPVPPIRVRTRFAML